MKQTEIAIKEYLHTVYQLHLMTAEKIEYFINLPSVKCESRSNIQEDDSVLLKVYKLNGHMKFTILNFYNEYLKDIDSFVQQYCQKYKINIPSVDFDLDKFKVDIQSTIQKIESNIDTSPKTDGDNAYILSNIKTLFESIDILISLEYKFCAVPDYRKLDILQNCRFKIFRSNQLFYRVRNIIHRYPRSSIFNLYKTSFLPTLDKLTEGQDTYW